MLAIFITNLQNVCDTHIIIKHNTQYTARSLQYTRHPAEQHKTESTKRKVQSCNAQLRNADVIARDLETFPYFHTVHTKFINIFIAKCVNVLPKCETFFSPKIKILNKWNVHICFCLQFLFRYNFSACLHSVKFSVYWVEIL